MSQARYPATARTFRHDISVPRFDSYTHDFGFSSFINFRCLRVRAGRRVDRHPHRSFLRRRRRRRPKRHHKLCWSHGISGHVRGGRRLRVLLQMHQGFRRGALGPETRSTLQRRAWPQPRKGLRLDKTDPTKFARYLKYCEHLLQEGAWGGAAEPAAPRMERRGQPTEASASRRRSLDEELLTGGRWRRWGDEDVEAGDSAQCPKKLRTLAATLANADQSAQAQRAEEDGGEARRSSQKYPPPSPRFFLVSHGCKAVA